MTWEIVMSSGMKGQTTQTIQSLKEDLKKHGVPKDLWDKIKIKSSFQDTINSCRKFAEACANKGLSKGNKLKRLSHWSAHDKDTEFHGKHTKVTDAVADSIVDALQAIVDYFETTGGTIQ
eukprot:m.115697 g.115697  ORF g.115697 m.115697 type:complete len:120 (+) comp28442_c1_seq2:113-472(+)